MFRHRRWRLPFSLLEIAVLAVMFGCVPTFPWRNLYCPVDSRADHWSGADDELLSLDSWILVGHDYLTRDGRLYLRTQSTRSGMLLCTIVDAPTWDADTIAKFRTEHADLNDLWPEPSAADGGLRWQRGPPGEQGK